MPRSALRSSGLFVRFSTFAAELNRVPCVLGMAETQGYIVPSRNYFIQQVTTLLRLARETTDPRIAVQVLDKAAALTEHLEEAPAEMDVTPRAPDVHPEQ